MKRYILVVIAILVVAAIACGGSSGPTRTPTPQPKTGWLYCPDCASEGIQINLWENCSSSRGKVTGKANHADEIWVYDSTRDATENRLYYRVKVKSTNAKGCVPETLIAVP